MPFLHVGASIAGAFHRDGDADAGSGAEVIQGELELVVEEAGELESEGLGVDHRNVKVDEEVVHPHWRHLQVQGLQREAVAARRQVDFFAREVVLALRMVRIGQHVHVLHRLLRHLLRQRGRVMVGGGRRWRRGQGQGGARGEHG